MEEKRQYSGISVYPGVVYAKTLKWHPPQREILPEDSLTDEEIPEQVDLFLRALKSSDDDLKALIQKAKEDEESDEILSILESQNQILNDFTFKNEILNRIQIHHENAVLALENTIKDIYETFSQMDDEFFRERGDHIHDIGKRVWSHLENRDTKSIDSLEFHEPFILVANDLSPSELILVPKQYLVGIATDMGGKTGHTAILARNYGIPTIVGLKNLYNHLEEEEQILLDATQNRILRDPPHEEIIKINTNISKVIIPKGDTVTSCGTRILLKINLEDSNSKDRVKGWDLDGVGLFRSESILLESKDRRPTEDEQFEIYSEILKFFGNKPVTIRTYDIGADKLEVGIHEDNPFLGNRGIRFSLRHEYLFMEQIRALLRASYYGNLKVMIPMVSSLFEVKKTSELIRKARQELLEEGKIFKDFEFGIMVETPACAWNTESYAPYVNFYSLGTNDLLQYLVAVERNHALLSELYNPYHIVFLRTLLEVQVTGRHSVRNVSICGEIATDPFFIKILLGIGYREISIAIPFFGEIQELIRSTTIAECEDLSMQVFSHSREENYKAIEDLVKRTASGGT